MKPKFGSLSPPSTAPMRIDDREDERGAHRRRRLRCLTTESSQPPQTSCRDCANLVVVLLERAVEDLRGERDEQDDPERDRGVDQAVAERRERVPTASTAQTRWTTHSGFPGDALRCGHCRCARRGDAGREGAPGGDRFEVTCSMAGLHADAARTRPGAGGLGVGTGHQGRAPVPLRVTRGRHHVQRQRGVEESLRRTARWQVRAADAARRGVGARDVRAGLHHRLVGARPDEPDRRLAVELRWSAGASREWSRCTRQPRCTPRRW